MLLMKWLLMVIGYNGFLFRSMAVKGIESKCFFFAVGVLKPFVTFLRLENSVLLFTENW